jgi:hypothetical protein
MVRKKRVDRPVDPAPLNQFKILNIRENRFHHDLEILLDSFASLHYSHVAGQKEIGIQFGEAGYAFLEEITAAAREIGPADVSVENDIAAEEGFPFRPIQPDGPGGVSRGEDNFECFAPEVEVAFFYG